MEDIDAGHRNGGDATKHNMSLQIFAAKCHLCGSSTLPLPKKYYGVRFDEECWHFLNSRHLTINLNDKDAAEAVQKDIQLMLEEPEQWRAKAVLVRGASDHQALPKAANTNITTGVFAKQQHTAVANSTLAKGNGKGLTRVRCARYRHESESTVVGTSFAT